MMYVALLCSEILVAPANVVQGFWRSYVECSERSRQRCAGEQYCGLRRDPVSLCDSLHPRLSPLWTGDLERIVFVYAIEDWVTGVMFVFNFNEGHSGCFMNEGIAYVARTRTSYWAHNRPTRGQ